MTKTTTKVAEEPEGQVVPGAPDDPNLPPDTDHAEPEYGDDALDEIYDAEEAAAEAEADRPEPPELKKADVADLEAYFGQLGAELYNALSSSITTGGGPVYVQVAHLGVGMTLNVRVSPEF